MRLGLLTWALMALAARALEAPEPEEPEIDLLLFELQWGPAVCSPTQRVFR